ncbi:kelch motif family protein [Stylonychia lemnae]|uniref:Kelch motif family protein n=1 Tax=Stylonychia lemnae TaxID=5949 RepID=A0A078B0E0_STYLE|nr:kelch motif family protein [Stylonychia lemnae]|eukprot:CDW88120.1 kelch motif family protein [Stylonychia lemnae]
MIHQRAYFAHAIKNDKQIYVIGGRGDSSNTQYNKFVYSQYTMERFDIQDNKWLEMAAILKEGRYHSTTCILKDRYIYVFGGYTTEMFYGNIVFKVSRKHEKLVSVRSDYIEMYDTHQDKIFNPKEERPYFTQIHLYRDHINNVGNLICFPLLIRNTSPIQETNHCRVEDSSQILITGGLFVGIIDVKSHVYNTETNLVNLRKELAMPYPDISKFYYHTPQNKVYVVGRYRVQEFDQVTYEWRKCGLGFVQFCEQSWSF